MKDIKCFTDRHWDLIIIGGGLSGTAAAISARREGLSVLLIEKGGFLGGAPGTMLINPFMPYSTMVDGARFELSRGFFSEFRTLLREAGGYKAGREDIHEEYVKLVLDRLVKDPETVALFRRKGWIAAAITGGFCALCVLFPGIAGTFSGASDAGQPDVLIDALAADRRYLLIMDALRSLLFIAAAFGVL